MNCKVLVTWTDVLPVDTDVEVSVLASVFMPEAQGVQELVLYGASSVTRRTSQKQVQRTKVVISNSCCTSMSLCQVIMMHNLVFNTNIFI